MSENEVKSTVSFETQPIIQAVGVQYPHYRPKFLRFTAKRDENGFIRGLMEIEFVPTLTSTTPVYEDT